jgi:hypothetical protein
MCSWYGIIATDWSLIKYVRNLFEQLFVMDLCVIFLHVNTSEKHVMNNIKDDSYKLVWDNIYFPIVFVAPSVTQTFRTGMIWWKPSNVRSDNVNLCSVSSLLALTLYQINQETQTWVTGCVPLVEQKLLTFPEHMCSHLGLIGFVLLKLAVFSEPLFFSLSLYRLSLFHLWLLVTPLWFTNPIKPRCEHMCSGKVNSFCSTNGTHPVTQVTIPEISHEIPFVASSYPPLVTMRVMRCIGLNSDL